LGLLESPGSGVEMMTDAQVAIEAMDLLLRDGATVPASRVKEWLTTQDPDALSVVYEAISKKWHQVSGGLSPEIYFELVSLLFRVALREAPRSDYGLSKYDAATIYSAFLVQCANDPNTLQLLRAAAADLEQLYRTGDEAQKRCVVDGVLEHVFSNPVIRSTFSVWGQDPDLRVAYQEAIEWKGP
jgi:hypothetical protein